MRLNIGYLLIFHSGFGLIIPAIFYQGVRQLNYVTEGELKAKTVDVSRITSIFLICAYMIYVWFQMRTHHGIYDAIFEQDELNDADRHKDLRKDKLTFTECILALAVSIALVSIVAISLVEQIPYIVEERGVSDLFMGLILVPLVEKFAEHLTAIDEAWDNQMNFALSHVLGATIQTALFNAPLVVIVGWGLGKQMDFNFDVFSLISLILAILVVGNFLRDQKSNYLEGALCVIVYCIIAVAAFYFPNNPAHGGAESHGSTESSSAGGEATAAAHRMMMRGY
jgi:Ca2+:H+ antiporter